MADLIQAENSLNSQIPANGVFKSQGPEDTFSLGKNLGGILKNGSIVALSGPIGAGKTCFAKGIAAGLGVKEEVTSPTYTIISEYKTEIQGSPVLYHIDAYRLDGDEDFYAVGGEEIIFGQGISVIEWSENILSFIPEGALKVDITMKGEAEREIVIYSAKGGCPK